MDGTVTAVIDSLERAPAIVVPLVRQAAPEIVARRPPSGKWSIHEHACHLADVHTLMWNRLDEILSDPEPLIRSYDPGRDDPDDRLRRVNLGEALERYMVDRSRLVERLRRLTRAEWQKSARHDEYNSYSVFTMFRHLALHDFFHAYRIEELLLRSDWPPPLAPVDDDDGPSDR
jgi:DinB superfamily